jgi:serine/threonine protein kinase
VSFLGAGATSSVYECRLPNSQGEVEAVAAKVPLEPHTTSHEQRVLQELAAAGGGCPCIPRIMGLLDNNKGLLLGPVGKPLAAEGMLTAHPQLFNGFGGLVHALYTAHGLGWVHRDVRPDNLVLVGGSSLYLVDWCVLAMQCGGWG